MLLEQFSGFDDAVEQLRTIIAPVAAEAGAAAAALGAVGGAFGEDLGGPVIPSWMRWKRGVSVSAIVRTSLWRQCRSSSDIFAPSLPGNGSGIQSLLSHWRCGPGGQAGDGPFSSGSIRPCGSWVVRPECGCSGRCWTSPCPQGMAQQLDMHLGWCAGILGICLIQAVLAESVKGATATTPTGNPSIPGQAPDGNGPKI